jgi:protein-L-isoaspartate(D-aspartate) O-methyltransferase
VKCQICQIFIFLLLSATMNVFAANPQLETYKTLRRAMVQEQIRSRGVRDERVLTVMEKIERHRFVPTSLQSMAYIDGPLPIGKDQTISQPYIVAYMTEAAQLTGSEKVLEIGTGSGYQAAVLAELAKEVYTIEIIPELAERSKKLLQDLNYHNVTVKLGDGHFGLPEQAPFDVIMCTAAPDEVPPAYIEQLKIGGRLIIPVGSFAQELVRITKQDNGIKKEDLLPVRFVPLTGGKKK